MVNSYPEVVSHRLDEVTGDQDVVKFDEKTLLDGTSERKGEGVKEFVDTWSLPSPFSLLFSREDGRGKRHDTTHLDPTLTRLS